ncbi:MAG: hypothetical protein GY804_10820 [Alphaproteobacteria bacterium]|nr:hypothetical protein [Alphaproteobacteria bacterium]
MTKKEKNSFTGNSLGILMSYAASGNDGVYIKDGKDLELLHVGNGVCVVIPGTTTPLKGKVAKEIEEGLGVNLQEIAEEKDAAKAINLLRASDLLNQRVADMEYEGPERRQSDGIDADMAMAQVAGIVATESQQPEVLTSRKDRAKAAMANVGAVVTDLGRDQHER